IPFAWRALLHQGLPRLCPLSRSVSGRPLYPKEEAARRVKSSPAPDRVYHQPFARKLSLTGRGGDTPAREEAHGGGNLAPGANLSNTLVNQHWPRPCALFGRSAMGPRRESEHLHPARRGAPRRRLSL